MADHFDLILYDDQKEEKYLNLIFYEEFKYSLMQIDGEHITRRHSMQYIRYHRVMSIAHLKDLWLQDLGDCDNIRTPVYFKVPDIYRFVGGIGK